MFHIRKTFPALLNARPSLRTQLPLFSPLRQPFYLKTIHRPLYPFSTEKTEEKDYEAEYLKRKKVQEKKELEELKKKMGAYDAQFSLAAELFKILKSKILLGLLLGGACLVAYQFYTFAERFHDPVTNQEKIVFLKYAYEKKLAQGVNGVLKRHFNIIPREQAIYNSLVEQYNKVKENPELKALNFAFNEDINIIDRDDCIFILQSNGSLFVSAVYIMIELLIMYKGLVPILKEGNNMLLLMLIELGHIYLRTNAQNINLFDLFLLIRFKAMEFNPARIKDPSVFNGIRSLYCLPVTQEQETKMWQLMPNFQEMMGIKADFKKDLALILKKMAAYDQKVNGNIPLHERRIENYFKRHPYLLHEVDE